MKSEHVQSTSGIHVHHCDIIGAWTLMGLWYDLQKTPLHLARHSPTSSYAWINLRTTSCWSTWTWSINALTEHVPYWHLGSSTSAIAISRTTELDQPLDPSEAHTQHFVQVNLPRFPTIIIDVPHFSLLDTTSGPNTWDPSK
ncbi:hypothetical protein Pcinc_039724 [Petrolisthes cinctipes]|uniref:Uncharacterized protein n=1 Tax=Petrolisthes cinctipes TaxID=88211 RepID=A0AAE1EJ89_PETCI|nr:hypothetical protein Pcinc_039724 [Petrolisthes cinctipes]